MTSLLFLDGSTDSIEGDGLGVDVRSLLRYRVLIIGKNGAKMSPIDVAKQLLKTADKVGGKVTSSYYGNGRINAYRAISE